MAKLLLALLAVCVGTSIASEFLTNPLMLHGCVYCDTCRVGFETSASKHIAGAVVRIECKNRTTEELTFTKESVTDSNGEYKILVHSDRGDECCDAVLVRSPDPECNTPGEGRDRARVILTRNNGMSSNTRYANAMGFVKNTPLASCSKILQQYQDAEADD